MIRKPRNHPKSPTQAALEPSIGRLPTPPNDTRNPSKPASMASRSAAKPLTPRLKSKTNVPIISQQGTKKVTSARTPNKPNGNILNFFKKVDPPVNDDSIFLADKSNPNDLSSKPRQNTDFFDEDLNGIYDDVDNGRFNEVTGSVKKRKTSNGSTNSTGDHEASISKADNKIDVGVVLLNAVPTPPKAKLKPKPHWTGPFLSDSESEYEYDQTKAKDDSVEIEKKVLRSTTSKPDNRIEVAEQGSIASNEPVVSPLDSAKSIVELASKRRRRVPVEAAQAKWEALRPKGSRSSSESSSGLDIQPDKKSLERKPPQENEINNASAIPALKQEATSVDEWGAFDNIEDFPDGIDEYADGEELIERKWMEEQARLEAAEAGKAREEEFGGFDDEFHGFPDEDFIQNAPEEEMTAACPICNVFLNGISSDDATKHVNGCLDGNPIPLPVPVKTETPGIKFMPEGSNNRFARKAAVPRPGQANPFEVASASGGSSAFSKIMSGHVEDAAWATAAAAEQSSRGKPAYQRTCPFYKIMPGFFICVDAFRYGAVQGCNAYFLSHFHSDHYVGLTSSWCHGPIYCSKVTANLVKQQLRVDPTFVVALEFEEKFEVPGTQAVSISMIPANHCPGSSLFLFEKVVGKGPNPKVQRVLHCGDFRACPEHVKHPLLMPTVVDSINGKDKHQKIDVCYLDTTYLNPRYAFPSQEGVIKACADMCVSLKKERAEESDAWETAKRERAGSSMLKFINSATSLKPEDDSIAMEISSNSKNSQPRGRLLVVCGTYSIGKERICMGIARALDCKIWAPPGKMRICATLEDPELMSRMTDDPRKAQIHMQMLMEIRAETLQDYLNGFKPHFSRVVGFRPSGWNYKPPVSRSTASPTLQTILHSPIWRSSFTLQDLVPQRGSTREASCFGVPYSEHSSFRELTMFVCALRIEKVVPTVNVGSAATRAKMKLWIDRWLAERRKNGPLTIGNGEGEVKW